MNNDFDDRRRQPADLRNAGHELVLELLSQSLPFLIAFVLLIGIQRGEFVHKKSDDMRVSLAGRCHRFDYIPGVERMVVAVVADELAVLVVRREESACRRIRRLEYKTA